MVVVLCWNEFTDARADMTKMPQNPYDTAPLRDTLSGDVKLVLHTKSLDFMKVGAYVFVSAKAKAILEAHNVGAEFCPVTLTHKKRDHSGWFYLHMLVELDCIDAVNTIRAGSECAMPEMVKYLVLKESVCGETPLFHIGDSCQLGVSDELAFAIQEAKCTGVFFQKAEEWRNPGLHYR